MGYEWFKRQCAFFHEHHITDRWNLKDREDTFQLYYQLEILGFRYFELANLQYRDHQYARSHNSYAKSDALGSAVRMLFPWKDSSGRSFSDEFNRVQREIAELEEKFGER